MRPQRGDVSSGFPEQSFQGLRKWERMHRAGLEGKHKFQTCSGKKRSELIFILLQIKFSPTPSFYHYFFKILSMIMCDL